MTTDWFARYFKPALATLTITSVLLCSSCGTILHPERRGQPAGRLDPKIVALDAVGMLFFFVPGVIAFAVDFSNGTIYLPPDHYGQDQSSPGNDAIQVKVDPSELNAEQIERIVETHTNKDISLVPGSYSVQQLDSVADLSFDPTDAPSEPRTSHVVFRGQSF